MIAWTIPTSSPITRSYSSSFTFYNTSTSYRTNQNGVLSLTFSNSTFQSGSGTYSETQSGATYSYQWASRSFGQTGNSNSQKDDSTFDTFITASSSNSGSLSQAGANVAPFAPSQTSTTQTAEQACWSTLTSTFETSSSWYTTITSYTTFLTTDVDPYYIDTTITGTKGTFTISYIPNDDFPESYTTVTRLTTIDSTFQNTIDTTFFPTVTATTEVLNADPSYTTTTTDYVYVSYHGIATIYQANTRDENAEILYRIPAISSFPYIAPATLSATTGTRFTISPSVETAIVSTLFSYTMINGTNGFPISSRTGTATNFLGSTQSITYTASSQTTRTLTYVSINFIPHSTGTYTQTNLTTETSSLTSQIWQPYGITHGFPNGLRATISTEVKTNNQSIDLRLVGYGDITYNKTIESSFTRTLITTTQAYNTSGYTSFSYSESRDSTQLQPGLSWTVSFSSASTEIGNTVISGEPRISTGNSPFTSASSFITEGFVLKTGTETSDYSYGGWITANGSRTFSTFGGLADSWYALAGDDISGTIIFPRTNNSYTFNLNFQTFTITSLSDGSTITTTASHQLGLSGSTITIIDTGRKLGSNTRLVETVTNPAGNGFNYWLNFKSAEFYHFGCLSIISGQTIINKGGQGAYRNLINSATISLDGNDTIYSGASTGSVSFLRPIKSISPLVQSTLKNDIIWAEARNSTAIPFYRLPQ